jgi:2-oxo-3-hexenedioate decarboxylase
MLRETKVQIANPDKSVSAIDCNVLAQELMSAYSSSRIIAAPPSARVAGFDLAAGYAVEAELARLRRAAGRTSVGRKVGYASKAVWRALKLNTLVWAHMYDDTVRFAETNDTVLSIGHMCSPKIEPEIVFKLKRPLGDDVLDPAAVLESVEWLALGFEIIDCVYADWKFQPADFVAAFGLHSALIVGQPRLVDPGQIAPLVEQLAQFKVRLSRDGALAAEGSGRNVLRSPALCLGELASAISRQSHTEPLATGELVSSGTLTESLPIGANETWTAAVDGIDLPALTVRTTSGPI